MVRTGVSKSTREKEKWRHPQLHPFFLFYLSFAQSLTQSSLSYFCLFPTLPRQLHPFAPIYLTFLQSPTNYSGFIIIFPSFFIASTAITSVLPRLSLFLKIPHQLFIGSSLFFSHFSLAPTAITPVFLVFLQTLTNSYCFIAIFLSFSLVPNAITPDLPPLFVSYTPAPITLAPTAITPVLHHFVHFPVIPQHSLLDHTHFPSFSFASTAIVPVLHRLTRFSTILHQLHLFRPHFSVIFFTSTATTPILPRSICFLKILHQLPFVQPHFSVIFLTSHRNHTRSSPLSSFFYNASQITLG
ncbi:unnamed protein product [Acanthosepion pharaonis]|uniref:Uncharacterized protein n=1 Tax=Acanthosepion pharaonis TaxID=158019 RepID=A0A812BDA5_ACAPH|nr:unnamed protein product [Sepia pharaonis]